MTIGLFIVEIIIIVHREVVQQLNLKVRSAQNIVFARDVAIDLDMDGKAICVELGGQLLVDLYKHVVRAFYNTFLTFLFTDTV